MNHSRIDTTQVYLRALNRSKAMEAVRDLSWGFGFQANAEEAHTGFGHPCKSRGFRRLGTHRACSDEQFRVVELTLGDDMGVCPGGRNQVVMADELPDSRPRHPAKMQKANAPVPEVVRRKRSDASRRAGSRDRRPKTLASGLTRQVFC
jgi:hypothetical protein